VISFASRFPCLPLGNARPAAALPDQWAATAHQATTGPESLAEGLNGPERALGPITAQQSATAPATTIRLGTGAASLAGVDLAAGPPALEALAALAHSRNPPRERATSLLGHPDSPNGPERVLAAATPTVDAAAPQQATVRLDNGRLAAAGADLEAKRERRRQISRAFRARQRAKREAAAAPATADKPKPRRGPRRPPKAKPCAGCGQSFAPATAVTNYCSDDCRAERIRAATKSKLAARADPLQQWPPAVANLNAEVARLETAVANGGPAERPVLRRQLLETAARLERAKLEVMAAEAPDRARDARA
jgi:hypothetical protein